MISSRFVSNSCQLKPHFIRTMRSLICWVIALAVFASVFASQDAITALTDKTKQQQKEELKAQFRQLSREEKGAKKLKTKIQTITQCRSFDIEGDGCRNPISAYPASPRHIEYDWDSRYTITWDKVNDDYEQIFGWETDYCGSVNKSMLLYIILMELYRC